MYIVYVWSLNVINLHYIFIFIVFLVGVLPIYSYIIPKGKSWFGVASGAAIAFVSLNFMDY